jgi:general secretion pathway protein B
MSLILEALRKSEAERRRGEMPDLRAELPPPAAASRAPLRRVLPWIAVALSAGIALLFGLRPLSRDATPAAPTKAVAMTMPAPAPAESVRLQPRVAIAQPPPAPRIAEREPPKPQSAPPAATTIPDSPPEPASPPASAAEVAPPSVPAADTETAVNAMPADLRKALPPLQLSMHMWDPDPAKRFVILDGERHVEGDSVGPMQIRRIDASGVLFDWQGRLVRLPLR